MLKIGRQNGMIPTRTTFKIMWSLLKMALQYEEQELVNGARI